MPVEHEVFLITAAAIFGAAVGSFLNVCIYRLPREGLSVERPARSFCTACGDRIAWFDNLPIVSWVLLGGRCRGCRSPIALRYLLVEALTAALFAVVVHRYLGYIEDGSGSWGGCVAILALVAGLLVAGFIDGDLRVIPDEVSIGGMHLLPLAVLFFPDLHARHVNPQVASLLTALEGAFRGLGAGAEARVEAGGPAFGALVGVAAAAGLAAGTFIYRSYRRRFQPELPDRLVDSSLAGVLAACGAALLAALALDPSVAYTPRAYALTAMLAGMLAGSSLAYAVRVIGSHVFRKPAMGFGDVKLMGLLGGVAGWNGALVGFFVACLLGSIYGIVRLLVHRDRYLPFGPFLSIGCMLFALWPETFHAAFESYLALFRF